MISWAAEIGDEFEPEFDALHRDVQTEILGDGPASPAVRAAIEAAACRYAEGLSLRKYEGVAFYAGDGEWRIAFAFDPKRKAILLVAGDKSGVGEKRFYRELIHKAITDSRPILPG